MLDLGVLAVDVCKRVKFEDDGLPDAVALRSDLTRHFSPSQDTYTVQAIGRSGLLLPLYGELRYRVSTW